MSIEKTGIPIREFARQVGLSEGAIRKYIRNGVIGARCVGKDEATGWPVVFPDLAKEDIEAFKSAPKPERKPAERKAKAPKAKAPRRPPPPPADDEDEDEDDDGIVFHPQTKSVPGVLPNGKRSKAELDRLLAEVKLQQAAIQLRQTKGELVEKVRVYRELYELGQELRKDIMAVPDRTLDNIRAAKTRSEAYEIMRGALADVLTAFSQIKDGDLKLTSR